MAQHYGGDNGGDDAGGGSFCYLLAGGEPHFFYNVNVQHSFSLSLSLLRVISFNKKKTFTFVRVGNAY